MMNESIDPRLLDAFKMFDSFCRKNGVRYSIDHDQHNQQGYLVKLGDTKSVKNHMAENINEKMVVMEVDDNRSDGTLFTFGIRAIGEEDLEEDQLKGPTRSYTRRQHPFRSSFRNVAPGRSYVSAKKRLNTKLAEALKLKDDLVGHDNVTKIPKGTEVRVHDPDPELPDVDWDGTTTNVDRDKLEAAIDKASEEEFKKIFNEGLLSEQATTIGSFLTSRIHEGYTVAADRAFAAGYMSQEERIDMSDAITDALKVFTKVMKAKYPQIYNREMDGREAINIITGQSKGTFRERIDKRIRGIDVDRTDS